MSVIATPELKNLVWDILTFTDDLEEVEEGGKKVDRRVMRKTYNKKYLRGVKQLKQAISQNVSIALLPKERCDEKSGRFTPKDDVKVEELEWVKFSEYKQDEGKVFVAEKHDESEIEVSEKGLKALKFYYGEREEITDTSEEALDELETLLGVKE